LIVRSCQFAETIGQGRMNKTSGNEKEGADFPAGMKIPG
jgi:hypothetical protein